MSRLRARPARMYHKQTNSCYLCGGPEAIRTEGERWSKGILALSVKLLLYFFAILQIKLKALCMLDKHSTTEIHHLVPLFFTISYCILLVRQKNKCSIPESPP